MMVYIAKELLPRSFIWFHRIGAMSGCWWMVRMRRTHTPTHGQTKKIPKLNKQWSNDDNRGDFYFYFFYSFILVHFFFLCSRVSVYNGPNNLNWHLHTHTHTRTYNSLCGYIFWDYVLSLNSKVLYSHSLWPMAIAYRIKWKNRKEFHFFFSLSVCVCMEFCLSLVIL